MLREIAEESLEWSLEWTFWTKVVPVAAMLGGGALGWKAWDYAVDHEFASAAAQIVRATEGVKIGDTIKVPVGPVGQRLSFMLSGVTAPDYSNQSIVPDFTAPGKSYITAKVTGAFVTSNNDGTTTECVKLDAPYPDTESCARFRLTGSVFSYAARRPALGFVSAGTNVATFDPKRPEAVESYVTAARSPS